MAGISAAGESVEREQLRLVATQQRDRFGYFASFSTANASILASADTRPKRELVEAAGVETSKCVFSNWLMAHAFWSNSLIRRSLSPRFDLTLFTGSRHESTTVLETIWRRAFRTAPDGIRRELHAKRKFGDEAG